MPAMRANARESGFSLVELITVTVIAVMLAAVALPRFAGQQSFQERGFYDEAMSAARYAQKLAVVSGCQVQMTVAAGTYTLNRQAATCTTGGFGGAVVHPGTRAATFTGTAPSGVTFSMTNNPVVFDALGKTTDGATRTVTVGPRTFQIIGATGYVHTP